MEFRAFDEEEDSKIRGPMLDEALELLLALWSGEPVNYHGQHYHIADAQFLPRPVQEPRIPIWVAGSWRNNNKRRPFRRAARFEGVFPFIPGKENSPEIFKEMLAYVLQHRTSNQPFDVICGRRMDSDGIGDAKTVAAYARAGVTWWMVRATASRLTGAQIRQLVRQGPPGI